MNDSAHLTLAPGQLEALYMITLTDFERELLTGTEALLSVIDNQRKYILSRALEPHECPACHGAVCQRSAGWDLRGVTPDDSYACPICEAKLTWHLEITGRTWFTLNPGQTVTVPPAPEKP